MKKLFLSILAIAAVVSCNKSNTEFETPSEIGINPVAQGVTKSMMTGTAFQASESFNVWAYYKQLNKGTSIADWQASPEAQQTYIDEKTFVNNDAKTWKGESSYYWPKVGSLMFVGYYPTSAAEKISYEFSSNVNKMTISDYQQDRVAESGYTEDLMYFNMTSASANANNVQVVFKHALSWLTVNLIKGETTATITVNSVDFTNVLPQGDAVVDGENAIVWAAEGDAADVNVTEGTAVVLEGTKKLAYEPLFIPQEMAGNIVVNYTIASTDGSQFTEVKTIALNTLSEGVNSWDPAKHYVYNITVGTGNNEILIEPSVSDWAEVSTGVNID